MRVLLLPSTLLLVATLLAGCGKGGADHASHAAPAGAGGHVHVAPHGGVLVELGAHEYNLEVVAGPGRIDLYVLDGHAEHFVRVAVPAIAGTAATPAGTVPVAFAAVADTATGETVGDTSRFSAAWPGPALPSSLHLDGVVIRGKTFDHVHVDLPAAGAPEGGNRAPR